MLILSGRNCFIGSPALSSTVTQSLDSVSLWNYFDPIRREMVTREFPAHPWKNLWVFLASYFYFMRQHNFLLLYNFCGFSAAGSNETFNWRLTDFLWKRLITFKRLDPGLGIRNIENSNFHLQSSRSFFGKILLRIRKHRVFLISSALRNKNTSSAYVTGSKTTPSRLLWFGWPCKPSQPSYNNILSSSKFIVSSINYDVIYSVGDSTVFLLYK